MKTLSVNTQLVSLLRYCATALHLHIFVFIILVITPVATLALPPQILCGNIPGCGLGPQNVIYTTGVPMIAQIFLNSAALLSLIFVMVGGARLVIGFGNDESFTKARQTIQWALGGFLIAILSHRIVMIVISEVYVTGITLSGGGTAVGTNPLYDFMATIVNVMSMLLNVVFLIVVLIGGFRIVMARGKEDEVSKGRMMVIYAILGAVVINVAPFVVRQVLYI